MIRKRSVIAAVLMAIGVILWFWLFHSRAPEIEEITRAVSTGEVWAAKVEMVVYGDHWFVNDARYEVRIKRFGSRDDDVLVYSVPASGPNSISIKWRANDELVIEDSPSVIRNAFKQSHPTVRIDYVIR